MSTQTSVEAIPHRANQGVKQDWWKDIRALPTLPSVLFRFLGLVSNPKAGPEELADFIWKDPALLSRALPMANAGMNGGGERASSLRQGIASIGRERIRNLAYTTPLLCSFEPLGVGSYAVTYWERSLLCGHACEAAAGCLGLPKPDRYYVAGLLHDIGYLVLLHQGPALLPAILERCASRPAHLLEIEAEVMGMDHCELGLKVAARLGLDPGIHPAIGNHHCPTQDSDPISQIASIGSAFCNYQGLDFFPRRSFSPATWERELQEIIRGLLPSLSEQERSGLLERMEKAVGPIRSGIRQAILEWQVGRESPVLPQYSPYPASKAVAAIA